MQRLEYNRYGGPDVMHLATFTLPEPGPDEIVVRVVTASINPVDWKIRNGDMKLMTGGKFPRGMGMDFAGIVEAVGTRVTRLRAGDPVLGTTSMKRSGAFAPRLIASQDLIVKKPENLSFAFAATLPVAGVTAWQALMKVGQLRFGQNVFLNGASGAVGQAAIAIAREIGVEVVGRMRAELVDHARALGLSRGLDYSLPVPLELDHSFDIVLDANGSLSPREGDRLIRRGGKVIDIAPTIPKFMRALVSRSRKIFFVDLKASNLQKVVDLAAKGKLAIKVGRTIALREAPSVIAALERGERVDGKVVVQPCTEVCS